MRILLLCDTFNCLTQAIFAELKDQSHELSVEFSLNSSLMIEAVELFRPELIIAPMLTKKIPPEIWQNHTCLIVHPGIKGDRGISSLDWAILERKPEWGVTILQAAEEMDAGAIWWSKNFPLSTRSKTSLYRNEVVTLAKEGVLVCIERFLSTQFQPEALDYSNPSVLGQLKPTMKAKDRQINWHKENTDAILTKIRCGDSQPGALAMLWGQEFHLFNAKAGPRVPACKPGQVFAKSRDRICVATLDGSVTIGHLRPKGSCHQHIKLEATALLPTQDFLAAHESKDVFHVTKDGSAFLYFEFYNGAMSTAQCEELCLAYEQLIKQRPRIIVLMGGAEFFSNGINLNTIEAAPNPAEEGWTNILAMNRLVRSILCTKESLTISMLRANAGAGGLMMALAADLVWAQNNVIVNPYYKSMGGLYGSEFWTYSLPKKVGAENARFLTESLLPLNMTHALSIGLIDRKLDAQTLNLHQEVIRLGASKQYETILEKKNTNINNPAWLDQINLCEEQELKRVRQNFFGEDSAFHQARKNFVYKRSPSETPKHLARHRG